MSVAETMKATTDCAKKLIEAPRYNVGDFVGVYEYETDVRIHDIRWEGSCFVYKVYLADEETWLYDDDIADKKDEMIEGLAEEENNPKFKKGDCVKCSDGSIGIIVTCDWSDSLNCYQYYVDYIGTLDAGYQPEKDLQPHTITTMNGRDIFEGAKWKHEFECPDGYIFKDENGNVINAKKIVLEKVNTLKTQSDNMEHKELLLGLVSVANKGQELIPHKDYEIKQDGEKFYLVKKKKEYPKTYEECCKVMNYCCNPVATKTTHKEELIRRFQFLLLYRDAYWKIAGDEMGLGKPWEPDWNNISDKYCIYFVSGQAWSKECQTRQCPFAFPTPEMRDTFKENFDPDIEICKELL